MKAMAWYLGACPVCGGDMHDDLEDEGWMTCLLCARSVKAEAMRIAPTLVGVSEATPRAERERPEPIPIRVLLRAA